MFSDQCGNGFQIRWPSVSDRRGHGFRLVAMGFRSSGRAFQIEFQVVGFRWSWGRGVVCGCGFCSLWTVLGLMGFVRHSILHLPLYEASLSSLVWFFFFFLFLAMGLFFGWILIVVVVGSPWVCHGFGFAVE